MIKWPTPDPPDPKAKSLRRTAANRQPGKLALLAIRKQRLIQMTRWQNQNQTLAEILRIAALRTLTLCTAALSIASSCSMASAQTTEKQRPPKDLKYRKRVIVGPDGGDIPRRIDYQALSTRDTLMLPTYVPAAAARHAVGGFDSGTNTFSRDGIVPPPPPMKSALLPKSIAPLPQEETATARSISPPQRTIAHVPLSQARLVQIKTEAQLLFKKGKLAEAQALLSRYVSEYPQEASLKTELAKVSLARSKAHVKQGDHANAAKQARLAVSHSHEVSPEIASAADQALDASLQKLGVNPKDAAQRSNLGDKLSAQHRHLEAEVEYRTAARLKPSETAHIKAGNAAAAAGHHERAKASYQSALEINPDSSNALKKLGITRLQMRDYVGASADLTRALVINQGDKEAAHALISLWKEQVASRPQDANSHLGLARAYQVSGELAQAQAEYKIVVQLNPVHPHLPAARQSFKLALAKQEALKSFQSAKTMEAQGNLTGAYQKATDAVGLFPSDTNYKNYWLSLANKIRARGEELPTQTVGGNTSAISPQVMEQIRALAMPGEQPPSLNLPTAQAIGLAQSPAAVQAAQTAPVSMTHENGYRPLNTDTHVASIANFLDSMRTFTLQQQAEIDKNTQAVRQSLKAATSGIMGAPTASSTADPSLPSAGESGAGASGASGSVVGAATEAVTAQGTGSALSSATAGAAATPQAALASAAAALANTKMDTSAPPMTITGMALGAGQNYAADKSFLSSVSGMAASAAPTLMSGKVKALSKADVQNALNLVAKQSKAKATKAAASTSQPAPSLPPQATPIPAALPSLSAQAQPLELNKVYAAGNQAIPSFAAATGAAPSMMPSAVPSAVTGAVPLGVPIAVSSAVPGAVPFAAPYTPANTAQAMPIELNKVYPAGNQAIPSFAAANNSMAPYMAAPNMATGMAPGMTPNMATGMAPGMTPNMATGIAPGMTPNMAMPNQTQAQPVLKAMNTPSMGGGLPLQTARPSTPPSARLYLTGVKAARSEVQLKVTLQNDGQSEIKLPASARATVKNGSKEPQEAKVSFASRKLPVGGSVTGTIKVPGTSLSPAADIYIPAGSWQETKLADLHLSVPISQK
ncbi:MAG: hypothetical protein HY986_18935 [Candidatus Melainabacteria bacterium]|nr:hypothetical protein [Candidatus Melainabacteria bacterium]